MYSVGSKVLHPCHGAGTVTRIQSKCIGVNTHQYYVIRTVTVPGPMQLMVPVNSAESLGLREIGNASALRCTLRSCSIAPPKDTIETDYRARQATVREKLKSGSFGIITSVIRMYHLLDHMRRLGMTDRQMFDAGKKLLAGELALAVGVEFSEALQEIDAQLDLMVVPDA